MSRETNARKACADFLSIMRPVKAKNNAWPLDHVADAIVAQTWSDQPLLISDAMLREVAGEMGFTIRDGKLHLHAQDDLWGQHNPNAVVQHHRHPAVLLPATDDLYEPDTIENLGLSGEVHPFGELHGGYADTEVRQWTALLITDADDLNMLTLRFGKPRFGWPVKVPQGYSSPTMLVQTAWGHAFTANNYAGDPAYGYTYCGFLSRQAAMLWFPTYEAAQSFREATALVGDPS